MVLELEVPHDSGIDVLVPMLPNFLSYILSFIYVGIYWNNHHHLLHAARQVSGSILWANLNLLFWLSLFPFATGWMGANHFAPFPTAAYGVVLFMAAMSYYILQRCIMATDSGSSVLRKAIGSDWKGKLSLVLYLAAIRLSFVFHWVAQAIYVTVALVWLVPDKRIEQAINET
jgi:uncharacterized membrane protein